MTESELIEKIQYVSGCDRDTAQMIDVITPYTKHEAIDLLLSGYTIEDLHTNHSILHDLSTLGRAGAEAGEKIRNYLHEWKMPTIEEMKKYIKTMKK